MLLAGRGRQSWRAIHSGTRGLPSPSRTDFLDSARRSRISHWATTCIVCKSSAACLFSRGFGSNTSHRAQGGEARPPKKHRTSLFYLLCPSGPTSVAAGAHFGRANAVCRTMMAAQFATIRLEAWARTDTTPGFVAEEKVPDRASDRDTGRLSETVSATVPTVQKPVSPPRVATLASLAVSTPLAAERFRCSSQW